MRIILSNPLSLPVTATFKPPSAARRTCFSVSARQGARIVNATYPARRELTTLPKRAAALAFLTQQGKYTFPVALLNVETGTFGQVNYGYLVAGAVIAMVPCVVLYLTLQRYYVQGLTSGAVKG